MYHISGTIYTIICALHFSYLYPLTNQENQAFVQPPIPPLYPQWQMNTIKWRCTCMQTLELYGRTTFPAPFLSARYFDKLYNRSGVIMRIGWLVGPRKAHITSLWRYGGKQPPSGECHPSSNGLSDQDRQLHQARHIWPWHWSCKLLSQESMEPHNMP